MKSKNLLVILLVIVVMMFSACSSQGGISESENVPSKVTDSGTLEKIVVYNSSLCTVLEAFGKTDTIVGAYGSLAEEYGVLSCGKWNEVDVEAVISTGAEAIFGYSAYVSEEQIDQLSEAGIDCYFIELSDASLAADEVALLGELFGCEEKAQVFVDMYNTYDELLNDRLSDTEHLKVYVEGTSKEPYTTANSTTAAHSLVVGSGLVNIYADNETAYPERNLEVVISANPDLIVKIWDSASILNDTLYNEYVSGLSGVNAVNTDNVIMLNNECGTTAIGSIIGRLYIAKFAYPDLFSDIDVDKIYEELYIGFLGGEFPGSGAYLK